MSHPQQEIWRDVVGHPGYQVSDLGNLRTAWFAGGIGKGAKTLGEKWFSCSPKPTKEGYRTTRLRPCAKSRSIHRMVAESFLQKPEGKTEVNHKNGNKADNRVENLEWVTRSENIKHAYDFLGKKPASQKLTEDEVLDIRALAVFGAGHRAMARAFGVGHTTIGYILRRETFAHL